MDEQVEELLPFYALGTLTEAERARVEAYVAGNPQAAARLRELTDAAAVLPGAVTPVEPPAALKRSLMARVQAEARSRAGREGQTGFDLGQLVAALQRALSPAFALGAVIVAVGASVWALSLNSEVTQLRAQVAAQSTLTAQVAELQSETARLREELRTQNEVIAHLASPGALTASIAGTAEQPAAYGQLINDPARNTTILVLSGLPQLEPGKVYQFWWIKGETPIAAETFRVDADGRAVVRVTSSEPPTDYNAMGITIEPEGGSAAPRTQPVMLGALS